MKIDPKELPLGFLLNVLGSEILDETKSQIAELPIDVIELGILWLIDLAPGHRQSEYAHFQHRDLTTFGRYVDRLEAKGFVRRKPVPGDRRAWALHLTGEGKKILTTGKRFAYLAETSLIKGSSVRLAQVKSFLVEQLQAKE